jgi:hypothetical protein
MKRLLLASFLMAFGASAQATVTVGSTDCPPVVFTCTADVTCDNGDCVVENTISAPGSTTCTPVNSSDSAAVTLRGVRVGTNDPVCEWTVTDGSDTPVTVRIDGSDGFPVELQSLSVD